MLRQFSIDVRARFAALFGRRRLYTRADEELQFHLAMRERRLIESGLPPGAAHQRARRELGNPALLTEQTLDCWRYTFMDTLIQDVRYGLRTLRRNPGFATVVVAVLALGIAANTAIFTVIDSVLLKPLPYPEPDKLVNIRMRFRGIGIPDDRNFTSPPEYKDLERLNQSFSHVAALSGASCSVSSGIGAPERVDGVAVSSSFFPMLGIKPHLGRLFTKDEETPGRDRAVLIGHGLWQRRFGGDPKLVGQNIRVNTTPYQVIGVLPPGFAFPGDSEMWAPLAFTSDSLSPAARGGHGLDVLARVKSNLSLDQAKADATAMTRTIMEQAKEYPYKQFDFAVLLSPLLQETVGDVRKPLWILMGAAGAVLLIACANVAGLLLARASAREREIAIRVAVGAGHARLVRQLLTESMMLGVASGIIGLVLAWWGLRLLKAMLVASFPRAATASFDWSAVAFTVVLSLLTGIVFGLIPAWQSVRHTTHGALKEGSRGTSGGSRSQLMRRALVAAELAISLMLLVGAGLLIRSFLRLQTVDPGFHPENVLTMGLSLPGETYKDPNARRVFYRNAIERVRNLPGVQAAGGVSALPLSGNGTSGTTTLDTRAVPPDKASPEADGRIVISGYFEAMRIQLLRGRTFDARDTETSQPVAVIDESMADTYWPNENPIGKRLKRGDRQSKDPWLTVVGVVGHVRYRTLEARSRTTLYLPHTQLPEPAMSLVVRTAVDPNTLTKTVQREISGLDRDLSLYRVSPMDQLMAASTSRRRLSMTLLAIFAGCALLLAAVGLYGLMSFAVKQRLHEIGIRVALGASRVQLLKMVLGQSMVTVGAGMLAGLFGSIAVARSVSTMLFGVQASDPVTFAAVAAVLAAVAVLASYVPAHRATKVDPALALRNE